MRDVLRFPTQIISGYKGVADTLIATESGELAGTPAAWDTVKVNRKRQLEEGSIVVVLQFVKKPLKELPKVPKAIDIAKTDEQKKMVNVIANQTNEYSRPFVVPPGTPKDRVDILRKAFMDTMKDKEFLAEVEKMQVTLDPTTADELTAAVSDVAKLDQATLNKLKEILFKTDTK